MTSRKEIVSGDAHYRALQNEGVTPQMPPAPQPVEAAAEPANAAQAAAPAEDPRRAFLRLVSHELRTPLNSILGFSEILSAELYGPLGAPQYKEYAEIIRTSGKKLLKLVNQVLEIGRLEGVKLEVGPEAVEPALDSAVSASATDFTRGVRPRVEAAPNLPAVLADPWALRTVLSHLIQNAAAFAPDGGEVRLRAVRRDDRVDIFVEDDGEGVDPTDLPRLMQPFEQGDNALVRRVEGAGLGLAISELTCRAMGADLAIASEPGRGLSACVSLKIAG